MSTPLEPSAEKSPPNLAPTQVLLSRHRWARWRGVLLSLLIGLAATLAVVGGFHLGEPGAGHGKILVAIWGGGLLLTALTAAVAWRFAPASLSATAQDMDRRHSTKNRIEAAAALHDSSSPLAQAQREETAAYLGRDSRVRPVRVLPWLIAAVLALALSNLATFSVWIFPSLLHSAVPALASPPKEPPRATIVWKSPESETRANPVEEVPTAAIAQSTTGLKNLSLEISVNGEFKKSVPLPAQPFDQPGKNIIKNSLYLDELEVQPFDIISYFLRGQRITDPGQNVSDTLSTIQFIQVSPFREDVAQLPPGPPHQHYNMLVELKLAQLQAVKENFVLAHTDLPVTDPTRMKENDLVGKDQGLLSAKTEEVVQVFTQHGLPADMIDLLRQAEPLMDDSSKKILTNQNVQALPPQGKALSLLIAAEKFLTKHMSQAVPGSTNTTPDDPFQDKQLHELTKRYETPAGQLEQLAKNQAKLANDLGHNDSAHSDNPPPTQNSSTPPNPAPGTDAALSGQNNPAPATPPNAPTPGDAAKTAPLPTAQAVDPFEPDSGKGTPTERQTRVLQGIGTLKTNNVLPSAVNAAMQDAQKHATESLHQLDQAGDGDAREPSATAAQDLQRAANGMNKAGEEQTRLALQQAQQQLNDLAQQLRDLAKKGPPGAQPQGLSEMASKVQDVQTQLNDAADQQQQAGSTQSAEELNHLANQITNQNIARDLGTLAQHGIDVNQTVAMAQRLEALAGQAAGTQAPGDKPSVQDIARLINALETSRANLAHLAGKAGGPGQASEAGQGQGQKPGAQQGQGQDQGQGQGQQPGGNQPEPGNTPGSGNNLAEMKAYRETLADVKNETQQISALVPGIHAEDVQNKLPQLETSDFRQTSPADVAQAYQTLAPPLDKLISDLRALGVRTQREDIVKQPDLDEAPLPYRPAVSDYFETMSRDYHPDDANADVKKP